MNEQQPSDSVPVNAPQTPNAASDAPAADPPAEKAAPAPGENVPSATTTQQTAPAGGARMRPTPQLQVDDLKTQDAEENLDREVSEALGDMSLMDVYGIEDAAAPDQQPQSGPSELPEGIQQGVVIGVSDDGVFVDMGGKSQGFLPKEELELNEVLEKGAVVKVAAIGYDKRDGLVMLSKRTAEKQILRSNLKPGVLVEGRVTGMNKGGLELDIKGLKAFMPVSQIDLGRTEDMEPFLGQKMTAEVTQVERGDKNIVVSRRNLLEKEREEQREQVWTELEVGQLRHGVVRSIMDYGAFVDIGGTDGLLHIREMSWARIDHPKDILSPGQGIDVVVIEIDREKQRIALSLKQAGGDPWTVVEHKYPAGSRHQAQIRNLADFGAFAELEPGVEGLIPISQMTWAGRIRHPSEVVKTGQMVEVEVMQMDLQKRRISLSMKTVQENPWVSVADKYPVDQIVTGTVSRLTDFGAFVTLEAGVDGLVHISEMAPFRVNRAADVVKEGQAVQVKVLSVDEGSQRIALSIKAASHEGLAEGGASLDISSETAPPKKKKDRPRRGGLSF